MWRSYWILWYVIVIVILSKLIVTFSDGKTKNDKKNNDKNKTNDKKSSDENNGYDKKSSDEKDYYISEYVKDVKMGDIIGVYTMHI